MFGISSITTTVAAVLGAAAAAVVTFGLVIAYVALVTVPGVKTETRNLVQAEARERAMELMKKANEDNGEISNFDLQHFCTEYGGRWVSGDCVN